MTPVAQSDSEYNPKRNFCFFLHLNECPEHFTKAASECSSLQFDAYSETSLKFSLIHDDCERPQKSSAPGIYETGFRRGRLSASGRICVIHGGSAQQTTLRLHLRPKPVPSPKKTTNSWTNWKRPHSNISGTRPTLKPGWSKIDATSATNDTGVVGSIASTGFGLTALCIGANRGYIPRAGRSGKSPRHIRCALGKTSQPSWILLSLGEYQHRRACMGR